MDSSLIEVFLKRIMQPLPSDAFDNKGSKDEVRKVIKAIYAEGQKMPDMVKLTVSSGCVEIQEAPPEQIIEIEDDDNGEIYGFVGTQHQNTRAQR